jgi:hypothetical protein
LTQNIQKKIFIREISCKRKYKQTQYTVESGVEYAEWTHLV